MRQRLLIGFVSLIGALLILPLAAAAQSTPPPQTAAMQSPQPARSISPAVKQLERDFLKNLLRDQKAIWTSPAHIRANDIWWLGSIAGATTAFIATDLETGDWIASYPDVVGPSDVISQFGAGYTVAG